MFFVRSATPVNVDTAVQVACTHRTRESKSVQAAAGRASATTAGVAHGSHPGAAGMILIHSPVLPRLGCRTLRSITIVGCILRNGAAEKQLSSEGSGHVGYGMKSIDSLVTCPNCGAIYKVRFSGPDRFGPWHEDCWTCGITLLRYRASDRSPVLEIVREGISPKKS